MRGKGKRERKKQTGQKELMEIYQTRAWRFSVEARLLEAGLWGDCNLTSQHLAGLFRNCFWLAF